MKRNTLNFVIDLLAALAMTATIVTGLLLRFVLPPGSGNRLALWGYGRHDWGDVHFWLAAGVGAVIVLHVALHWQWVCTTAMRCLPGRRPSSPGLLHRNLVGASLVILLTGAFGAFVWVASAAVRDSRGGDARLDVDHSGKRGGGGQNGSGQGGRAQEADGQPIRGSTTLAQAADALNISLATARTNLGVAKDVPGDQRLGHLITDLNLTMQQARDRLSNTDARLQVPSDQAPDEACHRPGYGRESASHCLDRAETKR